MPCSSPLKGYKDRNGGLSFKSAGSVCSMSVACGQCMGCRIDRSRAWAIRCVHESQKHEENSFLTLTYAPEHLPATGTLVKRHFQDFMKRLRKHIQPKKISFFHCGEYGEQLSRPHYHALIFGHDFSDKTPWKKSHDDSTLYVSQTLDRLWRFGHCSIGQVNHQTAAYCSSYILKKVTGDLAAEHYGDKLPEYITMSTRPAIGAEWISKFSDEVFSDDTCISQGRPTKPPRYYDKRLKKTDSNHFEQIKSDRKEAMRTKKMRLEQTPARLLVRATVLAAKISQSKRNLS